MKKFDVNSFDVTNCTDFELFCYRYAFLVNKYRKYKSSLAYIYGLMDILVDIGSECSSLSLSEVAYETITADQAEVLRCRYHKLKSRIMKRVIMLYML